MIKKALIRPLAKNKVRYIGEPVAVVVAEQRYTAEDALDLIKVEYETLPVCSDAEQIVANEAVETGTNSETGVSLLHQDLGTNVALHYYNASGNNEEAFKSADHVFSERLVMHRHSGTPIETRGIVARYDAALKELTVWTNNQFPHLYRNFLAKSLDMDENMIRVISANIGGSYGTKTLGYQEDILIPLLSRRLGVPVKWVEVREESFKATVHGREAYHLIEMAVKKDGTILGVKDKIIVNFGAYINRTGTGEAFHTASFLPGCYKFENYTFDLYGVVTNKTPMGPYRGYGKSGPNFVIERMVDIVARKLGISAVEIRMKNFIDEFPYKGPSGTIYDSGDYAKCLNLALDVADYNNLRKMQREARRNGEYVGIGICSSIAPNGGAAKAGDISPYEAITIRMSREGKVTVLTGSCGLIGTGHETTVSQIVSETIGINQDDVRVIEGDTLVCPIGMGTSADRSAVYLASASKVAAEKLRDKLLAIASLMLNTPIGNLRIDSGVVRSTEPEKSITVQNVVRNAYSKMYALPEGMEAGLELTFHFSLRAPSFHPGDKGSSYYPCFSNDCSVAVVKVDAETGKLELLKFVCVNDCGKIINPEIVEGQLQGGIVAGIGGTIYEELLYSGDGELLTCSFMDYLVPTAMEVPRDIESRSIESPSPLTVLGSKGVGESGTIGVYAAISNAVDDALSPTGIAVTRLPLNPEFVKSLFVKE